MAVLLGGRGRVSWRQCMLLLACISGCLLITSAAVLKQSSASSAEKEVEIITQPRPGEEYVFVQGQKTNSAAATPQAFSTSHHIPSVQAKQERTLAAAKDTKSSFATSHKVSRPAQVPNKNQPESELSELKRETRQTSVAPSQEELDVEIEDDGRIGVIDETEQADADEKKILARKAEPVVKKPHEKKETIPKTKPVHEEIEDDVYEEDEEEGEEEKKEVQDSKQEKTKHLTDSRYKVPFKDDKDVPVQKEKLFSTVKSTEAASLTSADNAKTVVNSKATDDKYDIVSVNNPKTPKKLADEGTYDFVDTPLADKVLTPSGTSQASRVNVKKGPNGQDYEYEYVYYYYDDEDEAPGGGAGGKASKAATASPTPSATAQSQPIRTTPQPAPAVEKPAASPPSRGKRPEYVSSEVADDEEDEEGGEDLRSFAGGRGGSSKSRYTTIERTRGSQSEAAVAPTTPEPASNEVLPTRGGNRFRGRQLPSSSSSSVEEPVSAVSEERLPANTRFPPRSRSNHNSSPVSTTPSSLSDTPITRVRGNSGSVKRPSLELVDSSSFRTHSSDSSPDQDQGQPQLNAGVEETPKAQARPRIRLSQQQQHSHQNVAPVTDEGTLKVAIVPQTILTESRVPAGTTRESDLEEYVVEPQQRPASRQRVQPTEVPNFAGDVTESVLPAVTAAKETGMTDKAAYDLYAILQQTQSEEANSLTGEPLTTDDDPESVGDELGNTAFTPQLPTTQFVPPTTTTTSTTTTTTTTTTTPEPTTTTVQAPAVRGRYRGGNGSPRNRVRTNGATSTTTTTTESPDEGATKRTFRPSKNRVEGQVSAYGRRGSKKPVNDQSESGSNVEEEVTPKTSGSRNRYRANSRGSQPTTTNEPPTEAPSRSRPSFGTSDRFNPRRRPGVTKAPVTAQEEESHDSDSADSSSSATTTNRPTRPRLNIAAGSARPLRPGPKINIGGRGKLGGAGPSTPATTASTDAEPSTSALPEEAPVENHEQAVEGSTAAPDALTRLRNRPRLRVAEKQPKATAAPVAANKRPLPNGLLARRPRPGQHSAAEATSEQPATADDNEKQPEAVVDEETDASDPVPTAASTTEQPPATPESKLSSLIGNRRRIGARRPGTLINRPAAPANNDE